MAKYTGGYVQRPMPIIIHRNDQKHTEELKQKIHPRLLDALHSQQCIPWRVDRWMLEVQRTLFNDSVPVPWGTPVRLELPPRVPEDVWAALSQEDRNKIKAEAFDVYRANNQSAARRAYWFRVWAMFDDLANGQPVFYPYSMDFRGRVYPRVAEGTVSGAEVAASVLERYVGEPVTDEGMFWLAAGVASYWGHDKLPFEERAKWANENWQTLAEWVDDPLGFFSQWSTADKPLRFIALAREFVRAHRDPSSEIRRSVHLDGTCNGFQHLSALVCDENTGAYVNLCPGPRQDLYAVVAQKMNEALQRDGQTLRAKRHQVKRAVMTTPYGLTKYGMLDQLKKDGVFGWRWDPKDGRLFRDYLLEAIETTAGRALHLMKWFQDVAAIAGAQSKPIEWTSPSGLRIRQAYYRVKKKEIEVTVVPGMTSYIMMEEEGKQIDKKKSVLAISPNITHSFDASHLHHVVTHPSISRQAPAQWVQTIHDSFGCHPNYVPKLKEILRETFAEQYQTDWLQVLYEDWTSQFGKDVPSPPGRGSLDVSDVLQSEYVFS